MARTIGLSGDKVKEFLDELGYMAQDPERAHIRHGLLFLVERLQGYETIYRGDLRMLMAQDECFKQALAVLRDLERSGQQTHIR